MKKTANTASAAVELEKELGMSEEELFSFAEYHPEEAERTGYSEYSYWKSVFRSFRKNKAAVVMIIVFIAIFIFSYVALAIGRYDYQHLVVDAWSGDILDVDAEIVFAHIFAVGRHESVLSAVEIVVHTLMQRQSGAQDGGDNHSFVHHMAFCRSEASFGVDGLEFECL